MGKLLQFIWQIPRRFLIEIINIYQRTLSPDHSWLRRFWPHGYCRFHPTCSEYGKQALCKYGVIRGIPKIIWRILRCNPWSCGGHDQP